MEDYFHNRLVAKRNVEVSAEPEENEVLVIKDEEDDGLDKFYIFVVRMKRKWKILETFER